MVSPRTLKIRLDKDGYYMELDDEIQSYTEEDAHWYLCKKGEKLAQIGYKGFWVNYPSPDVPRSVIEEAEDLTDKFSETIFDYYFFNKDYVADH